MLPKNYNKRLGGTAYRLRSKDIQMNTRPDTNITTTTSKSMKKLRVETMFISKNLIISLPP